MKKIYLAITFYLAVGLVISPLLAREKREKSDQPDKFNISHLYLRPYGKVPIEPDSYGKVKYSFSDKILN